MQGQVPAGMPDFQYNNQGMQSPQYIQPQPYVPKYTYPNYVQQTYVPQLVQQQTQTLPSMSLNGKVVDSFDVVKATDLPMDGTVYYFPKADRTEIYSKRWLPNGTTENVVYRRVDELPQMQEVKNPEWLDRMNALDERISRLEKSSSTKTGSQKTTKKEETE